MNEARAPTNEKLKEQILNQYKKGVKPKELSEKTGVSINTIKSWIKREKEKLDSISQDISAKKENAPSKSKKGAPTGNKNAIGAGAPKRNKNAEKHGAYSKIYFDSLNDDEKELLKQIDYGEEYQLERQIDLYTIRERRLLTRINQYKKEGEQMKGMLVKKITREKGAGKENSKTEFEAVMNSIITLESELTKIQRSKTNAINSLILFRNKNREWEESERVNGLIDDYIDSITQTGEEEIEDDGFLRALNEEAATIWEDTENE